MDRENIKDLLNKFKAGTASEEEKAFLELWYSQYKDADGLEYQLTDRLGDANEIWASLPVHDAPQIKQKRLWPRLAAAASIIIAIGAGIWFMQDKPLETAPAYANDIAPGKHTATITLADGKVINLSDAKSGVIIAASGLKYNDGTDINNSSLPARGISPQGGERGSMMLTASTPRGGMYQVTLPDGSKVWLNAASSIKFPATFAGLKNREVELTGEAYFEVFRNKSQPFVVNSKKLNIRVLGTHFNVNAYEDEGSTKATLLEGAVWVVPLAASGPAGLRTVILRPNEQAAVTGNSGITVKQVDAQAAIDWKNGDFVFKNEDFKTIMRKVARWYNVEIVYDKTAPADIPLGGLVSRSKNISSILKIMEATGDVHFKVEGRRITVTR